MRCKRKSRSNASPSPLSSSITDNSKDGKSSKTSPKVVISGRPVQKTLLNKMSLRNVPCKGRNESEPRPGRGRPPKYPRKEIPSEEDDEDLDEEVEIKLEEEQEMNDGNSSSSKGHSNKGASDIKLRRRDKIKTTDRYSPEAYEPMRRTRKGGAVQFPSTAASSSKYISFDSDDDINAVSGSIVSPSKRRKSELTTKKEVKSYIVDVKKDEDSNKMLIMLPDGTTYKVDATPSGYGSKQRSAKAKTTKVIDEDFDDFFEDDGALDDNDDEDFKPNRQASGNKRRKTPRKLSNRIERVIDTKNGTYITSSPSSVSKAMLATGIKLSKPSRTSSRSINHANNSSSPKVIITPKLITSSDGSKTTKITQAGTQGKTKVTFITTPKSVTLTATSTTFKQPPKRNYGSAAKFIDELPDLSECTSEENDSNLAKLPDKILFVTSDLPLKNSLTNEKDKSPYLFRQVISPVMSSYLCLLCPPSKFSFKEEKDLLLHYSTQHEVTIEYGVAKFSEDVVFVCLPKSILSKISSNENSDVILNAPCQYCGEDLKLGTVEDMKNHYSGVHSKEIQLIEQEEILNMHKSLHCSMCFHSASDFATLHKHLKSEHKLHTFICKGCPFTTQDSSRIKTHFKAKHMISNTRMQNIQCCYCNGLVIGIERMNKHIMTSHCVQTGPNEFSCTSCLQPCGKLDELLPHSYKCPMLSMNSNTVKESDENKALNDLKSTSEKNAVHCFLCDQTFDSEAKCNLHLNHIHTKWSTRNVIHDTFLMVQHPNGKTDLMPSSATGPESSSLKLTDLPALKVFDEIGSKTSYGHYCFKCESVIKIYPLYYLHMYNVHKLGKVFECKVSSCKQTFKDPKALEEHIKLTKHPQKSVIEDPLSAIACHYCNVYFSNEKEMQDHHLSEEHFHKINLLVDKSGNKPEPRNHKCKTCHTWFGLSDSFIYHMETESHKHGCPYCGLHFALPSSRRTHIQSHHSEKADICELCNEKQGSKERLFGHLVNHNIVFECNRCMRKFYQREQLNAHMETHGEALDCPWQGCTKKVLRSTLSTHIRQHRIENESKCNICGKGMLKVISNKQLRQKQAL